MTALPTPSPLQAAPQLLAQGKLDEAAALAEQVLAGDPADPNALHLLGVIALQRGEPEAALRLIAEALRVKPAMPIAHYNHGNALVKLKRYPEALTSFEQALVLRPDHVESLINAAVALAEMDRHKDAVPFLDRALVLRPNAYEALFTLGNVLLHLDRNGDADAVLATARALKPDSAPVLNSRGVALGAMNRHDDALALFDEALKVQPDYPEALGNRATALRRLNRLAESRDDLLRLAAMKPGDPDTEINLMVTQLALCDWSAYQSAMPRMREMFARGTAKVTPFESFLLLPSAKDQHAYATQYAARYIQARRESPTPPACGKIRIAYVSTDFFRHAVMHLLVGVLESHDRDKFHITAVALSERAPDAMRKRAQAAVDRFMVITEPDDARAAEQLRAEGFDIAVDIQGYTRDSRLGLFARGIAPVQVSYLGFTATLGGTFMDYILADHHVVPESERDCFTEQVVYLPDSYQPNDSRRPIAPTTLPRAAHGLPEKGIVFCCFNNPYKIMPPVFTVWMRILAAVPDSVLWLPAGGQEVESNLRKEAHARGVDPARLVFAPRMPELADHLARLRHADLALDTQPYNAHTTNSDALWAGVPVIACRGDSFVSRVGVSLLHAVGLPELAVSSLVDYESLAIALGKDPARLAAVRQKLAGRAAAPLFDTVRTTRHLEAAFATMHARRLRGLPPESFSVPQLF